MNDYRNNPLILVIFGITGNLSHRKLLPAIIRLQSRGELPEKFKIIGITRQQYTSDKLFEELKLTHPEMAEFQSSIDVLAANTSIMTLDLSNKADYEGLLNKLRQESSQLGVSTARLYYLSIPSQAFESVIHNLGETGHNQKLDNETTSPRIMVEKPFGYDTLSAKKLIEVADKYYQEDQIYRIDHYLAKETAQNILIFRFHNPLFQSIWNSRHIDEIRVSAFESIGIEGRADFYEKTGALRDILQSHLLQLLAIVAMEKPNKLDSTDIHKSKLRLLDSINTIMPEEVSTSAVRGQYESYRSEVSNPSSNVETFARLKLNIDNEQWRGVSIVLETGKGLAEKCSKIDIHFRENNDAFGDNTLTFRLQPKEGITMSLQAKQLGLNSQTDTVEMEFDYAKAQNGNNAEAYERVIIDAVRGDQSLFASAEEVMSSWRIVENVIQAWQSDDKGLKLYQSGTRPDSI